MPSQFKNRNIPITSFKNRNIPITSFKNRPNIVTYNFLTWDTINFTWNTCPYTWNNSYSWIIYWSTFKTRFII